MTQVPLALLHCTHTQHTQTTHHTHNTSHTHTLPHLPPPSPAVYQFLVTLLDSQSGEVCFAACGVLTNLSLDPPSRATLTQEGVVAK